MTGVEIVLPSIIEGATGTALHLATRRLSRLAKSRRKRGGGLLNTGLTLYDVSEDVSFIGILDDLPDKMTLRDINVATKHLEVRNAVYLLLVVKLAEAPPGDFVAAEAAVSLALGRALGIDETHPLVQSVNLVISEGLDKAIETNEKVDSDSFRRLRELASHRLGPSSIDATHRYAETVSTFDSRRQLGLDTWERAYRAQVIAAHGFIVPPDFDKKRKVALADLYVSPTITESEQRAQPTHKDIADFVSVVDRTVLLGDPGGGKSTAAAAAMNHLAKDRDLPVPFLVTLREFAGEGDIERSISTYIASQISNFYSVPAPEGAVEYLLLSGRAFVVFDGLDELLDTSLRRSVTDRVELFANRYPSSSVLVTSRRVGYREAQLDPSVFDSMYLGGFDEQDVRDYVTKWFSVVDEQDEEAAEERSRHFLIETSDVPDLIESPLMLSLMCIIYRGQGYLPKNRPDVYERCAVLLFETWDSSRKIRVSAELTLHFDAAIKHLALWMLQNQGSAEAVLERQLVQETAEFLDPLYETEAERLRVARDFVAFCRGRAWVFSDAGTNASGERLYKFTHRTFMEYFAAYQLTRINDGPEDLAKQLLPKVASAEWDVVAQLAVQIQNRASADGAQRVLARMLRDGRRRTAENRDNVFTFIWRCLEFSFVPHFMCKEIVESTLRNIVQTGINHQRNAIIAYSTLFDRALPELRSVLYNAISERLRIMLDGDGAHDFAAELVVLSAAQRSPVREWGRVAAEILASNRDIILGLNQRGAGVWRLAQALEVVCLKEYVEASQAWTSAPLDCLFSGSGHQGLLSVGPPAFQFSIRPTEATDFETIADVVDENVDECLVSQSDSFYSPSILLHNELLTLDNEASPRAAYGAYLTACMLIEMSPSAGNAISERHDDPVARLAQSRRDGVAHESEWGPLFSRLAAEDAQVVREWASGQRSFVCRT